MLATLGGVLALVLGLAVLLLPLLLPELSRSRDAVWGAVVLLLGLVLVTSAERLTGAPMLGVLCGGLLIGRLGVEVAQGRWRQLTPEEQQRLGSAERWRTAVEQSASAAGRLVAMASQRLSALGTWLQQRRPPRGTGKRWVRPETPAPPPPEPVVVSSFQEIDALIEAAEQAEQPEQAETGVDSTADATAGEEPEVSDPSGRTG